MEHNDRELVRLLLEDVQILDKYLVFGEPSPQEARAVLLPILRKWICEQKFYNAQKSIAPIKIKFNIYSNSQAVKLCDSGYYESWMCMTTFRKIGIGSSRVAKRFLNADGKKPSLQDPRKVESHPQEAKQFFKQKMLFLKGNFYTREDLISDHANKFGGVHIDFRRNAKEVYIDEAKEYFGLEIKPDTMQMLVGEEITSARNDAARRPNLYNALELIAIDTARIFSQGIGGALKEFEEKS